ncbi:cytochrome P450 [Corynascus novoguineensis]|uniref:Cytochrome P450 n=1 Tax=Corynascus novoguineensis TaxID=1126955 RepID=A0AAN7HI14_9PEZI|nr:cytochrome P450 [Corynascus novoguineensis]
MLDAWFREHPDQATRVIGDAGEIIVLPPNLTNEMRNDPRLSFSDWIRKNFHAHLPGFEGFREGTRDSRIVQEVIMKDLTKYLNKVTEPLSEETALAVDELYPASDDQAWHTISPREKLLRLVARVSSRVFLGGEVCRNEAWLRVTREYTVNGFRAAEELRLWPAPLRNLVHWFVPSCRRARADVAEARRVISGLLEKRRLQKQRGEKVEYEDAVEWFEREARGREYDPTVAQLTLSFAAIHTTTELVTQVMTDICRNPEILDDLRREMVEILRDGGWKKASLYNMKLLDSVIKESLRLKPTAIINMRRVATDNVQFSDGTFIPKGHSIAVTARNQWDSKIYDNPDQWDGRRFLRMRETPGQEHQAQLVSTSAEYLAFGHGQHACPGRFFASNEAKVILIHLLLRYDWRLPEDAPVPRIIHYAWALRTDPTTKLQYRRRTPEIEL